MALDATYFFKPNTITTNTAIEGKDASQLDMNDFLNLMVAQMTNQDMMNPVNDTEFIAQMAQFSALQGIQTIQEYQLSTYATSYAGKYVTIANQSETGSLDTITGLVEAVSFYDGTPKVQVDGKTYDLYKVMEVSSTPFSGSLSEAAAYIGKTVTVSYVDDYDETQKLTGRVTSVTIKDGAPHIVIGGKEYSMGSITSVVESDKDTEADQD